MEAKFLKRYSSYKSQSKFWTLVLSFFPNGLHETSFVIFEILIFKDFFFNFQIHHCSLWKPQLSRQRATVEQKGVKFGTRG